MRSSRSRFAKTRVGQGKRAYAPTTKDDSFKSLSNDHLLKSMALLLLLALTFGSVTIMRAQNLASIDIPLNIEGNKSELSGSELIPTTKSYTVTGTVFDEKNVPLGGVNVVLKGTKEGTVTDFNGRFEFPRELDAGETLVFSFLGYEKKEYAVVESESEVLDIEIAFDSSDIILMGAVEVEGVYASKRNIFQRFVGIFKK